jgi:hypothetical protein
MKPARRTVAAAAPAIDINANRHELAAEGAAGEPVVRART